MQFLEDPVDGVQRAGSGDLQLFEDHGSLQEQFDHVKPEVYSMGQV
jgi:hypothetical protein